MIAEWRQVFYAIEIPELDKTTTEYYYADDHSDLSFDELRETIEFHHEPLSVRVLFIIKSDRCEITESGRFRATELYV